MTGQRIEVGRRYEVTYTLGRARRTLTGVYLGTGRVGARGQEVSFDLRPDHGTTTLWSSQVTSIIAAT